MLRALRDVLSPKFLASPEGAVFWFGKFCVICAVFLLVSFGHTLDIAQRFSVPEQSEVEDSTLSTARTDNPLSAYASISTSPLFAAPVKTNAGAPTPPPSPLKLRLVGINELSDGERTAIIEETSKQQQDLFSTNDMIFEQAKLVQIASDRVQLERNGQLEQLLLAGAEKSAASADSAPDANATEFTVPETELNDALSNLPVLLSQARAVPYFRNGQSIGMRLFAIRSGSLYEKFGLKNGDILTAVNNNSLSDPTMALKLFENLKNERSIAVKVERNGEPMDLNYTIR